MQLVRLADCPAQPWRNGGGMTRELLRWPLQAGVQGAAGAAAVDAAAAADAAGAAVVGAGADDWLLRVSVAEIERDGPFSPFAGVERWFAVLRGAGVRLALPGGEISLAPGEAPLHFAGEQAPGCRLRDGPTQDLNLMQRRGSGRAAMQLATEGSRIGGATLWRAVYTHTAMRLRCAGTIRVLPAATLCWSDAPDAGEWQALDTGIACWMSLRA